MEKSKSIAMGRKTKSVFLILLCWLVYSVSYLGKVNYSANITGVMEFYGITKAQAGIPSTFLFFAYGIGQVLNGILCKKYNIRWMIFFSLLTSSIINLAVALTTNFAIVKYLWLINGFVLSMLWPTLIRLLSENLPKGELSRSSAVMGTTVALGTLAIYGLSSVYAVFDNFKLAFYTAAFAGALASVVWMLFFGRAVCGAREEKVFDVCEDESASVITEKKEQSGRNKKVFFISVFVLCFCAVATNLTKDGLTTWLPAMLQEEYSVSDSLSILLTVLLPIVGMFSNLFALMIHKKIPDYVTHCAMFFGAIFLFEALVLGSLSVKSVFGMLLGLVVVSFLASGTNNIITVLFPMFMRDKINSGLYAGVLNGFCYLGSTISSYGLGVIADNFGWKSVFYTLMGFCVMVFVAWGVYMIFRGNLKKAESE